jgi:hypothetical protein
MGVPMNFIGLAIAISALGVMLGTSIAEEMKPSDLPNEVVAFVGRRAACTEWTTKLQSDQNNADITKILGSLQCEALARDETILRQTYQSEPPILAAFDSTWVKIVRRVPVTVLGPSDADK